MTALSLARALHVLAVVIWIGGVGMMTTVLLPALRTGALGANMGHAFQEIERRFVWYAHTAVLLVGATGFYMVEELRLWARFRTPHFRWSTPWWGLGRSSR